MQNLYEAYGNQVRVHPVEVLVTDTSGRYFFPDDSILRNRTIIGLAVSAPVYDDENAAWFVLNSPSTDRPLIVPDAFFNAYVSLLDNNIFIIDNHPLSQYAIFPGDKEIQQLYTTSFTPSKSYIEVSAPATAGRLTAGQSILLHFFYLGDSKNG